MKRCFVRIKSSFILGKEDIVGAIRRAGGINLDGRMLKGIFVLL
jgi:hypothetical protein